MGKINILSAELSNKIAAGEVVERPSSVVKELVENSIDAGSTNIKVIIKEFGIQQIRIIDNGSGISNDDLARAFLRHATSKISADYDLFHIETLGFRGEALASISSVSKVTIKSCAGEAQGKILVLEGGKVVSEEYYAPIKGTDLSVENLFYNTPARLKYLRNPHTEQANITNIIHKFALSYPNVAFELHVDGKITFKTYGDGDVHKILSKIYNMGVARNMIEFSGNNDDYKVFGYISVPEETRASKNYINIFINGRYIKNYGIQNAIIDAYGTLLMINRYPLCVINIEMDPILLDVNVHPTKQEVRLSKEAELIRLIKEVIAERLSNYTYIPQGMNNVLTKKEKAKIEKINFLDELDNKFGDVEDKNIFSEEKKEPEVDLEVELSFPDTQEEVASHVIQEDELLFGGDLLNNSREEKTSVQSKENTSNQRSKTQRIKSDLPDLSYSSHPRDNRNKFGDKPTKKEIENFMNFSKKEDNASYDDRTEKVVSNVVKDDSHFNEIKDAKIVQDDDTKVRTLPDLKVLAQIFKTYILSEADNKLFLIDQHAAAERYNYEKLQREFIERKNYKKQMLIPLMFDFSVEEAAEVRNNLEKFEELGIVFEEFGDNSYVVREFPGWIEEDEEQMIKIIVEKVLRKNNITFNELRNDAIAMASCKMSIKANQVLTDVEMNKVISDLYECKNPFTCPHGRPIITKMEKKDLEKMFKRIV
ncbi:DNA mismatch repair endonuclease MutL [Gemella haemolysans]|uniref:DNA mismatch repair protein MutL n=1 Tax=Gemella haemolysans ATCC 10379 TaxID=546270 RepID=C5NVD0_9BACL|nr:DNA mismatch repair endonuclease MutL [Gemella haemolysans]EER68909.1 DNA mismatch repair domain protein [Gemella haemolysans ATCC 10379]KAA8706973.1 DNA mismatch repair endonuclease MutL [Gemella haemolysans]UBH81837.1 DNA mismatch repair endonuclease MutL [Gemella haemolysans]